MVVSAGKAGKRGAPTQLPACFQPPHLDSARPGPADARNLSRRFTLRASPPVRPLMLSTFNSPYSPRGGSIGRCCQSQSATGSLSRASRAGGTCQVRVRVPHRPGRGLCPHHAMKHHAERVSPSRGLKQGSRQRQGGGPAGTRTRQHVVKVKHPSPCRRPPWAAMGAYGPRPRRRAPRAACHPFAGGQGVTGRRGCRRHSGQPAMRAFQSLSPLLTFAGEE